MGRPKGSVNGVRLSSAERSRRYAQKNRAKLRKKALERYYANHEESKERQRLRHRELRARGVNVSGNRNRLAQPATLAAYASALRWNGLYDEWMAEQNREAASDSEWYQLQLLSEIWFSRA